MCEAWQKRANKRKHRGRKKWLLYVLSVSLATFALIALLFALAYIIPIPEPAIPEASQILDTNGQLIKRLYVENRTVIPLSQVPKHLINAVISIEDSRFYKHHGIDPVSILRAAYKNVMAGRIVEGGSTITQQLAKNLFLTPKRSLRRKLLEALITLKLETKYSKSEILEMYLNQIYFGHGAYGIEVASHKYFGKPAAQLSLSESALLAGIIRRPEHYSPYKNLEASIERRNAVINRMLNLGLISHEQAHAASKSPVILAGLREPAPESGHLVDFVIEQLNQLDPSLAARLYNAGLTIYTTANLKAQVAAFRAINTGLPVDGKDSRGVLQPQGALVAINPRNGHIIALVGGRNFELSQLNRAAHAKRQPGSAFKPFVYVAALDAGYPVIAKQTCEPVSFPGSKPGEIYIPTDYGSTPYHYRALTMREAIAVSDNVVAVKWAYTLGPSRVTAYARRMGVQSFLEPSLPIALGVSEVSPLELAAAYVPLANMGYKVEPIIVTSVTDRYGNELYTAKPTPPQKVLDERVAYVVTDLLKGTLKPGGTAAAVASTLRRPAAGKTGTTENSISAWFVGYTPELVAAVYVGHDDGKTSLPGTGGSLAAPIWARFMEEALAELPPKDFPVPHGIKRIEVCPVTGLLPNPTCPKTAELFLEGTEPSEICPENHASTFNQPELPNE